MKQQHVSRAFLDSHFRDYNLSLPLLLQLYRNGLDTIRYAINSSYEFVFTARDMTRDLGFTKEACRELDDFLSEHDCKLCYSKKHRKRNAEYII